MSTPLSSDKMCLRVLLPSSRLHASQVRRIYNVLGIEMVLVLFDFVIYRRVVALFHLDNQWPLGRLLLRKGWGGGSGRRPISWPSDLFKTALLLSLLLPHLAFVFFHRQLLSQVGGGGRPHPFVLACFLSLGFYLHLAVLLLLVLLVEYVLAPWLNPRIPHHPLVDFFLRKRKLHTSVSLLLAALFSALGAFAVRQPPRVVMVPLALNDLPAELADFRIALLTDLHIGPTVGRDRVRAMVDLVNEQRPDLVALSGDVVDGEESHWHRATEPMRHLKAGYGVYYTTGNHEYYHGNINEWIKILRRNGIKALRNSHEKLRRHLFSRSYICLAGVDDVDAAKSGLKGHAMNVSAALDGCSQRMPSVVLIHQPNGAKLAIDDTTKGRGRIDLILSGHTHGGQFYVFFPLAYWINAYFVGLYRHASGTYIYVSPGVNYWGPPMKILGMSEISLLILRRAS